MSWKTLDEEVLNDLEAALEKHELSNPQVMVNTLSGKIIPEGTPVEDLIIEGGVVELEIYDS